MKKNKEYEENFYNNYPLYGQNITDCCMKTNTFNSLILK